MNILSRTALPLLISLASLPGYAAPPYTGNPAYPTGPMGSGSPWAWGVRTQETPQGYVIVVQTHGFSPRELHMGIRNGVLVVERTQLSRGPRSAWSYGRFHWAVPLPPDIDPRGITGRASPGMLKIFIPRRAGQGSPWLR